MGELNLFHLSFLAGASILAGIVDTIAGGGGLITVPALLGVGVPPILALGTNKFQSCLCEFSATAVFRKKQGIRLGDFKAALLFTLLGSLFGTLLLQVTNVEYLKKLVPYFLLSVFVANLFSKKLKAVSADSAENNAKKNRLLPLGLVIGFYNGFFGPGTGTLWTVSLRRFLHLDLKKATMMTKPLNLVGNLTALSIFFISGRINLWAGVFMSFGALIGGVIGAHLVVYKDSRWLQFVFNTLMAVCVIGAFR